MNASPVQAENVAKHFGRTRALDGCSFSLPEGSVTGLVGPNGAGKSTLLSLIAGLAKPTSGEITVHGTAVHGRMHPDVSLLTQKRPLYDQFTVREMMRAGAAMNDRWSSARADEVLDLLAGVDKDAKVRTLSAGARTQVAIAFALGRLPKVLLLDEPLSDLDPLARDETLRIVMTDVAERGTTVLLSSHLLTDLGDVCDHLLLLDEGRVQVAGDIDGILDEHRVVVGPAGLDLETDGVVVDSSHTSRQTTALVRGGGVPEGFQATHPDLEALVMGYLRASRTRKLVRAQ
ncbi:ABC-2 type transport system ATP-binding protein [Lentzea waywayandensis]|uniref:ABC-2 type transport system ATP-binding protein n=1 Tax=Lentzea waywayandensis TaxID=84724 RepID=A0A1I6FEV5_9PSEU|nr:ABC transporter ATP-binding protein [Lentzea waywayandensis]SFR28463.1 ABC-2 type transport system ATP-binding protein [Lentzea waywayandensis]